MFHFGTVIDAVLLVFGVVWCKHVFARLRSDLVEFRSSDTDRTDRCIILFFWLITLAVIIWIGSLLVGLFQVIW